MVVPVKQERKGKQCFKHNITFTTKDPWTRGLGYNHMRSFMSKQPKSIIDYVLYPEYTDNSMIHFHGCIWYSNKVHFHSMLNHWRRYFGFVKITDDRSILSWHFYCRKDQWLWNHRRINSYNVDRPIIDTTFTFSNA